MHKIVYKSVNWDKDLFLNEIENEERTKVGHYGTKDQNFVRDKRRNEDIKVRWTKRWGDKLGRTGKDL